MDELNRIALDTAQISSDLLATGKLQAGQQVVIGCSTSEVAGSRIGTAGSREIAAAIYEGLQPLRDYGLKLMFQCCEHLNRALVMEYETALAAGYEEVAAVPVPKAGGSMAAYAYRQLQKPCLVERIQAHAGIDIGDTLIGMHLRHVAVPVRPRINRIGDAHVNMAVTRPKLIGGERAMYVLKD